MIDDLIIKELRKHKTEIAKEFNNDIRLLAESMRKAALDAGYKLVNSGVKGQPK